MHLTEHCELCDKNISRQLHSTMSLYSSPVKMFRCCLRLFTDWQIYETPVRIGNGPQVPEMHRHARPQLINHLFHPYFYTWYCYLCSDAFFRVYIACQLFSVSFEYRLTSSFKRYCSLFLGTTALTPVPVFSSSSISGDSVDRIIPKLPDTFFWTLVQFSVQDNITSIMLTRTDKSYIRMNMGTICAEVHPFRFQPFRGINWVWFQARTLVVSPLQIFIFCSGSNICVNFVLTSRRSRKWAKGLP